MLNIGIVGSRRRDDDETYLIIENALFALIKELGLKLTDIVIVSGGCNTGAENTLKKYLPMKEGQNENSNLVQNTSR